MVQLKMPAFRYSHLVLPWKSFYFGRTIRRSVVSGSTNSQEECLKTSSSLEDRLSTAGDVHHRPATAADQDDRASTAAADQEAGLSTAADLPERPTASDTQPRRPTFAEAWRLRQRQARRSLLVQVKSAASAGALSGQLRQYGHVRRMFHFTTHSKDLLLVEMDSEAAVAAALADARLPADAASTPALSPLLWLRSGRDASAGDPETPEPEPEPDRSPAALQQAIQQCDTLDEQLRQLHRLTRLSELGARRRQLSCLLVERALSGLFPAASVRPFGSSASGFGRHDCDVDMVLELSPDPTRQPPPPRQGGLVYQTAAGSSDARVRTQRHLATVADLLTLMPGCQQVRRILKARVPIIKYTNALTGVDCDLSMQRDGRYMTELLYLWDQADGRVAPLMRAVRHWADQVQLTCSVSGSSGAGQCISNFGLTLLVVYFLQRRPRPLLPTVHQLCQLARADDAAGDAAPHSFVRDPARLPVCENREPLSTLLAEFFHQMASLSAGQPPLSVVWGCALPAAAGDGAALHLQNPLDRQLNVTKNVTPAEVRRLATEAAHALRLLSDAPANWWAVMLRGGRAAAAAAAQPQPPRTISVRALYDPEPPRPPTAGLSVPQSAPAASVRRDAATTTAAAAAGAKPTLPTATAGTRGGQTAAAGGRRQHIAQLLNYMQANSAKSQQNAQQRKRKRPNRENRYAR